MRKVFSSGSSIWFFIALILCSMVYSYHEVFFFRPMSIHQWRQADCLSLTLNYYKEGRSFLNPSVHWIGKKGTGETISEFPLIYYATAQLWKLLGQQEFILRMINTLILYTGLFYLYRIFKVVSSNAWAVFFTLIIFTSPVIVYYGNNFLADVPGFSIALIGWYYFLRFYNQGSKRMLYVSMLVFALASLLKITASINFVAILALFFLERIPNVSFGKNGKLFQELPKQIPAFLIVPAIVLSWFIFVKKYNNNHNAEIFLTGFIPIWIDSPERIKYIWKVFTENILECYHSWWMLIFFGLSVLFCIINFRKCTRLFFTLNLLFIAGTIAYFLLFFDVFGDHDYYMINLVMLQVITLINLALLLKHRYKFVFKSRIAFLFMLLLSGLNIYYAAAMQSVRYFKPQNDTPYRFILSDDVIALYQWMHWNNATYFEAFNEIEPYNRSLGIKREDKVISIPDLSINITLYLMDQKGFTDFNYEGLRGAERMSCFISRGAKYLFINNPDLLKENYIQPFIANKIGQYNNVSIYSLSGIK